jgi:hypothetical protein
MPTVYRPFCTPGMIVSNVPFPFPVSQRIPRIFATALPPRRSKTG